MGTRTIETHTGRVNLAYTKPEDVVGVGVTVKDGFVVKQGDVIGVITASGLARRRARAKASADAATNQAAIVIADNGLGAADSNPEGRFAVGDVLKLEDGTTIGTVLTVDADNHRLTCNANLAVQVNQGDAILASDGSQVARGIADKETDGDGDTPINAIVDGSLKASLVRGLDASAVAELAGAIMIGDVFKL